jgi:peroxiredoxin Q/BCP
MVKWRFFTLITSFISIVPAIAQDVSLKVGDPAPAFVVNDQNGNLWNSADYVGKTRLVIYFFPAAMTSGCTKEACSFRDDLPDLADVQGTVVGISGDPVTNLKIFETVYHLNFTLLSDVDADIMKKFGVPVNKGASITREIDGHEVVLKRVHSASRWTFVIDIQGKIVSVDKNVNPETSSKTVLNFLKVH